MKTDTGRIRAFTLIELLVVIGIIALLIGILIPVVGKVRTQGHIADTKNFLTQLSAGIETYHSDQRAYPGPLSNMMVNTAATSGLTAQVIPAVAAPGYDTSTFNTAQITMSENLVLGLLGGLNINTATGSIQYDASQVGLGPMNLNVANPKRFPAYVDPGNLDWVNGTNGKTGHYSDDAAAAADTIIPEFLDRFPDGMPILYLRARVGQPLIATNDPNYSAAHNGVITNGQADSTGAVRVGQYDLSQIMAYTQPQTGNTYIGTGKTIKPGDYTTNAANPYPAHGLENITATSSQTSTLNKGNTDSTKVYIYPYDAFAYFQNPSTPGSPRQKDGFILISPGPDRVYGTSDDICSFGDVSP